MAPRTRALIVPLLVPLALSAGCLLLRDVDALSRGASDAAEAPDASGLDGTVKPASEAGVAAEAGTPCQGDAGRGVLVDDVGDGGDYCIDATEVTVGDYRMFLSAKHGNTNGQPEICSWNDDFAPLDGIPDFASNEKPIVFVDYCDAIAFCSWTGKRLCGAIGGGAGRLADVGDPARSQWFRACSNNRDGLHRWPYGNDYDAGTCNGMEKGANQALAVASLPGCQGGYDGGLYDLSGNVREWEDACDFGATPDQSPCLVRGGAYDDVPGTLSCDNRQVLPINGQKPDVGFRCCSP